MELRHLRYFVKSAELLHFTRAAEALHVSQPTLSQQIRQLETELGAPVFERIGRSVHLTEAGQLFLEHARRALREVEGGRQGIDDLRGLLRGTLRVGVTYCFSVRLVPVIFAEFVQSYPAVHIVVTESTTRGVEQGLINAEFDLGLVFQSSRATVFEAQELFKEDIIVIVSRKHPLAGSKTLRFRDLKDVRLALPSEGFSTRQIADAHFAEAGIRPQIVLETNDVNVLLAVVRSGAAVSVVSRQAVAHLTDVAKIPLQEKGLFRTAALIWPRGTPLTAVGARFVEIATERLTQFHRTQTLQIR
jgi:LysR family transcriptional regulator, cyn operon transcriptional activator